MDYLIMFVVSVLLGLSYSLRTQAIIHNKSFVSSIWTAISVLVTMLTMTYAVKDLYQLVPICLGQALGNYIALKVKFFRQ